MHTVPRLFWKGRVKRVLGLTVECAGLHARVGDLGVTDSPLMPGGKARFGSLLVDVVTEGEFVEPAIQVEVIERRGNRVVVRAVS